MNNDTNYLNHSTNLSISDIDGEIWMPVDGYNNMLFASNYGRIKKHKEPPKYKYRTNIAYTTNRAMTTVYIVRQHISSDGYHCVSVFYKEMKVHRLVAIAFHGKPTHEQIHVNHIDGNKSNNTPENLEHCTRKQNAQHAWKTGLWDNDRWMKVANRRGENKHSAKLKEYQVRCIKKIDKNIFNNVRVGKMYNTSRENIRDIRSGKRWSHVIV